MQIASSTCCCSSSNSAIFTSSFCLSCRRCELKSTSSWPPVYFRAETHHTRWILLQRPVAPPKIQHPRRWESTRPPLTNHIHTLMKREIVHDKCSETFVTIIALDFIRKQYLKCRLKSWERAKRSSRYVVKTLGWKKVYPLWNSQQFVKPKHALRIRFARRPGAPSFSRAFFTVYSEK